MSATDLAYDDDDDDGDDDNDGDNNDDDDDDDDDRDTQGRQICLKTRKKIQQNK